MAFLFEIEDINSYVMPRDDKYKFASQELNSNIIFHKKFLEDAKNKSTNYVVDKVIGKGGASVVYKGENKDKGECVIIKELKTTNLNKLIREVNILRVSKGIPRVIKLLDFFKSDDNYYLVFPYYNCMPTRTVFYNFSLVEIKIFMYKFLVTLDKLHSKGIIHRDLKPGNLLVKSCNDFVIIDFGISDFYVPFRKFCNKIGTRNFKAPEQLLQVKGFDYGIDIWAAGLMFGEMFFQKYPFWKPDEDDVILENMYNMVGHKKFEEFLKRIDYKGKFSFFNSNKKPIKLTSYFERKNDDELMKNVEGKKLGMELFRSMMEIDPKKRITAKECLEHSFFEGVRI